MYSLTLHDFDPQKIAESGQCFRMNSCSENSWELIASNCYLRIEQTGSNCFSFSCTRNEFEEFFSHYFDLETDYSTFKALCSSEDSFLSECIQYGNGIRILNQDPFEMLITFIISQRRSIPSIRTAVEKISLLLGEEINTPYGTFHAFPTPQALADASAEALAGCGLGYRVPYVLDAARKVSTGQICLSSLSDLTDSELLQALCSIKGVGIKVASCTALFGFHRLNICPIDVWMQRVIDLKYHGHFPESYQSALGVLQQYMFHYAHKTRNL